MKLHSCGPSNINAFSNDVGSTQGRLKKEITSMEVILHNKYIDTELVHLTTCG